MSDSGEGFVLSGALRKVRDLSRSYGMRQIELSAGCSIEIGAMGGEILREAMRAGVVSISTSQADLLAEMRLLIDRGLLVLVDEAMDSRVKPQCMVSRAQATPDGVRATTLLAFEPVEIPRTFRVKVEYTLSAADIFGSHQP